jgi:hypothetical protein
MIGKLGIEADAGEEIEEQQITCLEFEADVEVEQQARGEHRQRCEQAACHRFRDVPLPQRCDQAVNACAGEKNDDRDGESQKAGNLHQLHGCTRSRSSGRESMANTSDLGRGRCVISLTRRRDILERY